MGEFLPNLAEQLPICLLLAHKILGIAVSMPQNIYLFSIYFFSLISVKYPNSLNNENRLCTKFIHNHQMNYHQTLQNNYSYVSDKLNLCILIRLISIIEKWHLQNSYFPNTHCYLFLVTQFNPFDAVYIF